MKEKNKTNLRAKDLEHSGLSLSGKRTGVTVVYAIEGAVPAQGVAYVSEPNERGEWETTKTIVKPTKRNGKLTAYKPDNE